ncbi:DUF1758 domain-containing protein [Trichonephila clavipes]|nr:DUF1758 domain-containing protein [Trichonephila clavipes]
MSDIFEIQHDSHLLVYADDIFLYNSGTNWNKTIGEMQESLNKISVWCKKWKLSTSPEKSSLINFSRKRSTIPPLLKICDKPIPEVKSLKILGIIFDSNITWKNHINYLRQKGFKYLNAIKALSSPKIGARSDYLLNIINATIRSIFDYGSQLFSFSSNSNRQKLEPIYNAALRLALGLPRNTPLDLLRAESMNGSINTRHNFLCQKFITKQIALKVWSPNARFCYPSLILQRLGTWHQSDFAPPRVMSPLGLQECTLCYVVLKNATTGKNAPDLATLYDMLETKLRALESLGRTKEKFANFLGPLVESCLPENVLRSYRAPKGGAPHSLRNTGLRNRDNEVCVRALLDDGSQWSYIEKNLAAELFLSPTGREIFSQGLFGGGTSPASEHKTCMLASRGIKLADVGRDSPPIRVLLGADIFGNILTGRIEVLSSGVSAVETLLAGHPALYDKYEAAKSRLRTATKRLINENYFEAYDNAFKQWESEGITEAVPIDQLAKEVHYLPHRPVTKPSSNTTKVRPIFDASLKKPGFASLNECLSVRPSLIHKILPLLLRFRFGTIGVIADMKQPFSVECHYKLPSRTRKIPDSLKKTIGHLKERFYVDNLVTSVNDVTELEQLKSQMIEVMKQGAFELRCWASNDTKEDQDMQMVLGLSWDVVSDELSCKLPSNLDCTQERPVTKRVLLSVINRVYDPIGFTAPALLLPKLLMQEAWRGKIGWDELLPVELEHKYRLLQETMHLMSKCTIPRRFFAENYDDATLHIFTDASAYAYTTCAFLRCEFKGQVTVKLIAAKARLTPMKKSAIP